MKQQEEWKLERRCAFSVAMIIKMMIKMTEPEGALEFIDSDVPAEP